MPTLDRAIQSPGLGVSVGVQPVGANRHIESILISIGLVNVSGNVVYGRLHVKTQTQPETQAPHPKIERLAYRPKDIIAATGIVRTAVYAAIKRGELKAVRAGERTLVVPAENLREWLASMPPAVGGD